MTANNADETDAPWDAKPMTESARHRVAYFTKHYAAQKENPAEALERREQGTTVAIQNALKVGLPIGAVAIALVTAISGAIAYGEQKHQIATNSQEVAKVEQSLDALGDKVETSISKLADQQAKQHRELIMLIFEKREGHAGFRHSFPAASSTATD